MANTLPTELSPKFLKPHFLMRECQHQVVKLHVGVRDTIDAKSFVILIKVDGPKCPDREIYFYFSCKFYDLMACGHGSFALNILDLFSGQNHASHV